MTHFSTISKATLHRRKYADSNAALAFQPCLISVLISGLFASLLTPSAMAAAAASPTAEMRFDSGFFASGTSEPIDLSRFNKANTILSGTYRVDLSINQEWAGRRDITFSAVPYQESAVTCFTRAELVKLGVDLNKIARGDGTVIRSEAEVASHQIPEGALCGALSTWVPGATTTFDISEQSLAITIPQIYMNRSARGYVDPALLDSGVTAGLLNYNFSASTALSGAQGSQAYLGLNSGINMGAWRLRHQGAFGWGSKSGRSAYQNTSTYLQRDISAWQSQLILGDSFTNGAIMDSVGLRGVTLASDDRQTPQSQQGYAPVVRGTANSNARVTIKQNNYVIYETTVASGPFVIDDLYPTGYGGDLIVTVTEADGHQTIFTVPYSAVPQLLRPGVTKYSAALGQLRQYGVNSSMPWVAQGTLQHGINNFLTAYGGLTLSEGYTQAKVGAAVSTPIGALSLDTAISNTQIPGYKTLNGQSYGITFNKNIVETGTNFALGAYRFSTGNYLALQDAVNTRDLAKRGQDMGQISRQKSRLDMSVSQTIGKGSAYLSGSSVDYWNNIQGRQTSFSVGYGSTWGKISWNLSAQRVLIKSTAKTSEQAQADQFNNVFYGAGYNSGRTDSRIMLTMSMPLGNSSTAPTLNTYLTHNTGDSKSNSTQVGVSGFAGEDRNWTYGVSGSKTTSDSASSHYVNANAGYQGSAAVLNAGLSQSGSSSQASVNVSGGIIAHPGGISFGQNLGDTIGIIHAPNAEGAGISSAVGVKVDHRGYAVVPNLQAYQNNPIEIDPKGSADNIEFKETTKTIAPRLGSVVMYEFETNNSRALVIKVPRSNGEPLPFAAQIFDDTGKSVGMVGQGGKAFVRGIAEEGRLTVKWSVNQCQIAYQLPKPGSGLNQSSAELVDGQCIPSAEIKQAMSTPMIDAKEKETNVE